MITGVFSAEVHVTSRNNTPGAIGSAAEVVEQVYAGPGQGSVGCEGFGKASETGAHVIAYQQVLEIVASFPV